MEGGCRAISRGTGFCFPRALGLAVLAQPPPSPSLLPSPSAPMRVRLFLIAMLTTPATAASASRFSGVVDSHVHVWGSGEAPFAYASSSPLPPADLANTSGTESLLRQLNAAGAKGALIVQPIQYKYDHSFVACALSEHPGRLKGMALLDPMAGPEYLPALKAQGFIGVRFNPALWPQAASAYPLLPGELGLERMSDERGARLFAQCGELGLPVGVMCFDGLHRHHDDIVNLLQRHRQTRLIIDHWGFFHQGGEDNEEAFRCLLALAAFPQVCVKVSAAFRNAPPGSLLAARLRPRFLALLEAYSPSRLLWGSDWPFVTAATAATASASIVPSGSTAAAPESPYLDALALVREWGGAQLDEAGAQRVLAGTAEELFGPWP